MQDGNYAWQIDLVVIRSTPLVPAIGFGLGDYFGEKWWAPDYSNIAHHGGGGGSGGAAGPGSFGTTAPTQGTAQNLVKNQDPNSSTQQMTGKTSVEVGKERTVVDSKLGDKLKVKGYVKVVIGKDGENSLELIYYNGKLISVSHNDGPFGVSFDPDGNLSGTLTLGTSTTGYMTLGVPIFSKDYMFSLDISVPFMGTSIYTGIEFSFRPGAITGLGVATFGIGAEAIGAAIPAIDNLNLNPSY